MNDLKFIQFLSSWSIFSHLINVQDQIIWGQADLLSRKEKQEYNIFSFQNPDEWFKIILHKSKVSYNCFLFIDLIKLMIQSASSMIHVEIIYLVN